MGKTRNYQLGKIYKICSYQTDECYVGSTTEKTLSRRLANHRGNLKLWIKDPKKQTYMTSFEILKYDDYYIELVELFPCNSKDELLKQEGKVIRLNNCVNRCIAGRSSKEYRQDNLEHYQNYMKEYREKNKEHIKETTAIYVEKNKEHIKEVGKIRYKKYYEEKKEEIKEKVHQYKIDNKEKVHQSNQEYTERNRKMINEKNTEHRIKNREEINRKQNEKINCDKCGFLSSKTNIKRHQSSKRCITRVA